jgi:hypothetical protein
MTPVFHLDVYLQVQEAVQAEHRELLELLEVAQQEECWTQF